MSRDLPSPREPRDVLALWQEDVPNPQSGSHSSASQHVPSGLEAVGLERSPRTWDRAMQGHQGLGGAWL